MAGYILTHISDCISFKNKVKEPSLTASLIKKKWILISVMGASWKLTSNDTEWVSL